VYASAQAITDKTKLIIMTISPEIAPKILKGLKLPPASMYPIAYESLAAIAINPKTAEKIGYLSPPTIINNV